MFSDGFCIPDSNCDLRLELGSIGGVTAVGVVPVVGFCTLGNFDALGGSTSPVSVLTLVFIGCGLICGLGCGLICGLGCGIGCVVGCVVGKVLGCGCGLGVGK